MTEAAWVDCWVQAAGAGTLAARGSRHARPGAVMSYRRSSPPAQLSPTREGRRIGSTQPLSLAHWAALLSRPPPPAPPPANYVQGVRHLQRRQPAQAERGRVPGGGLPRGADGRAQHGHGPRWVAGRWGRGCAVGQPGACGLCCNRVGLVMVLMEGAHSFPGCAGRMAPNHPTPSPPHHPPGPPGCRRTASAVGCDRGGGAGRGAHAGADEPQHGGARRAVRWGRLARHASAGWWQGGLRLHAACVLVRVCGCGCTSSPSCCHACQQAPFPVGAFAHLLRL